MKRIVTILIIITIAFLVLQSRAARTMTVKDHGRKATDEKLVRDTESFLDQLVSEDKFSGAVLIARNGTPIFKKAYGMANKGYGIPNRTDTKFNLGSMNKMFTAVAVLQLVGKGKISLDDTIGKHLPDYPNKQVAEKVTIHHLLTHTSGLGDYFNDQFENASRARFRNVGDFFSLFVEEPLKFDPGTRWRYSNAGFIVLGAIIEKVSGQTYFDYVRAHVYTPAGMINSDCYELDRDTPNLATGYTRMDPSGKPTQEGWRNNLFMHVMKGGPAGGGYSTVEDLLRFSMALIRHELLSLKDTENLLEGKVDIPGRDGARYAYGFQDERVNGLRRVGHGGGFAGINAQLHIYPETDIVVAVMSNYDPPAAGRVAQRIGKRLSGVPVPTMVAVSPPVISKYAGRYAKEADQPGPEGVVIQVENAHLWLIIDGDRHKFVPMSDTEFFDEEFEDIRLTFASIDEGEAIVLRLEGAGPGPFIGRKVGKP